VAEQHWQQQQWQQRRQRLTVTVVRPRNHNGKCVAVSVGYDWVWYYDVHDWAVGKGSVCVWGGGAPASLRHGGVVWKGHMGFSGGAGCGVTPSGSD